jgi:hypothetical protein
MINPFSKNESKRRKNHVRWKIDDSTKNEVCAGSHFCEPTLLPSGGEISVTAFVAQFHDV